MEDKARILIVDDNEINRDTLEGLIESLGHTAILADSGREALDLIGLQPYPDLVLLDIIMPEMNGYEVLQFIKKDKRLRAIPVIMVSVVDEMESVVQCIEAGADDYLTKPFNALLLKARINACLEKKRYHDKEQKFNFWLAENYQKLQQAEEARDSLFHMIVHDMNNPLSCIIGSAQLLTLLEDEEDVAADRAKNLENINRAAQQINSLVTCILDIAKMEKGKIPVKKTSIEAVQMVREISRQFEDDLARKNCRLNVQGVMDSTACLADEGLLSRILHNLLANAIKYGLSAVEPEIVLSVMPSGETVQLCVTDNGAGVPDEHIDNIFTKFYQVDHSTKGLGLGLTFSKMAVEAMGGTIRAENNPSGGVSFCLSLPRA